MGLFRKVISGSAAVATGGLSLGVVQFRSDTERNTRQLKLQRIQDQQHHEEMMAQYAKEAAELEVERIVVEKAQELRHRRVASSTGTPVQSMANTQSSTSISDRLGDLERLVALRNDGILSEAEYEQEKQAILRTI